MENSSNTHEDFFSLTPSNIESMEPEEAQQKLESVHRAIVADPKHPYQNAGPDHQKSLDIVQNLHARAAVDRPSKFEAMANEVLAEQEKKKEVQRVEYDKLADELEQYDYDYGRGDGEDVRQFRLDGMKQTVLLERHGKNSLGADDWDELGKSLFEDIRNLHPPQNITSALEAFRLEGLDPDIRKKMGESVILWKHRELLKKNTLIKKKEN